MTQAVVIQRLTAELLPQLTGDVIHDEPIVRRYMTMALDIGVNHFTPDMEEIMMISRDGVEIARFKGVTDASVKSGIRQGCISSVLSGIQHSAGGFLFRKVNPLESLSYIKHSKAS